MRVPRTLLLFSAALLPAASLTAQQTVTVPDIATELPGNAAISMPLRWSQGIVQVNIGQSMLPPALSGQSIRALILRRPAFFDEPAYPAAQPTLKVSMAFTPRTAAAMRQDLAANRPASLAVVAGPAAMPVAPTPTHGRGDVLAADLLRIPLNPPVAVVAGNLFLEIESIDGGFSVSPYHWVDAVHVVGGTDSGIGFAVGHGGCGSGPNPMRLSCAPASAPPRFGGTTDLTLQNAPPEAMGWILIGLSPQMRPLQFGFGGDLGMLGAPGCYQWTAIDVDLQRSTNVVGALDVALPFPSGSSWVAGQRIGAQAVVLDAGPGANPAGLAVSNGVVLVMDSVGVGPSCATVLAPGTATTAPWPPYTGLLPVLTLEY